jgi:hypothetical protein
MRGALLVALSCAVSLVIAAPVIARSRTTNEPAIFTVKVKITDTSVAMSPNHAARGSYITFVLTNRGKKRHTFVLGDVKRGPGHGTGFARTLAPDQQVTVVLYLDYRGVLRYSLRTPSGGTSAPKGAFRIT